MRRSSPAGWSEIDRGLIRLYVLHCAAGGAVTRSSIVERLKGHNQHLDLTSVSRILHGLELKGYLKQDSATYRATRQGRAAIRQAGKRLRVLLGPGADTL